MGWRHYEAEESKDEYRRNFKATNKDGSPGSGIVDEKPFWVFYYTTLTWIKLIEIEGYLASWDYS